MKETLITRAGLARLTEELERLKTAGRQEITERLRRAMVTDAVLEANSDYLAVRDDQAFLERRIARLEQHLDAARVAESDPANDVLDLGERVRVRNLDTGAKHEYELVGPLEADPTAGRISNESPVGRALMGRRKGEVALVEAPTGRLRFRILAIQ